MKLFNFLIIPNIIIFLSTSKATVIDRTHSKLNEIYIAPLANKKITRILLDFTASKRFTASFQILIFNDNYPKGAEIYNNSFYRSGKEVIEYDNTYTRGEDTLKIRYNTYLDGEGVCSHLISLLTVKKVEIDSNNRIVDPLTCLSYTPEKGWRLARSQYTFNGFEDLYIPTFYHKIDFEDFNIGMSENNAFIFGTSLQLVIKDYSSTFIKPDDYGYISIPMTTIKRDSAHYLRPNVDLYVNKETLEMSFEPHENYVKTNHFYLPRNEFRKQGDYSFQFSFTDFGNCKSRFTFNFKFNALNNTIGDCINSEYCITKR